MGRLDSEKRTDSTSRVQCDTTLGAVGGKRARARARLCVAVCAGQPALLLAASSSRHAHLLIVLPLGVHAVDDTGVLRLQRAHVILRRLDRVLLRQFVAMIRPLLLLLCALLAQFILVLTDASTQLRRRLASRLHLSRGLCHLDLLLLLVRATPRAVQLLLRLLEATALFAFSPGVVRLCMVAICARVGETTRRGLEK